MNTCGNGLNTNLRPSYNLSSIKKLQDFMQIKVKILIKIRENFDGFHFNKTN